MEIIKLVLTWIWENIFDIALVVVGASAFVTYFLQKKNEYRAAATLIIGQIDSIEEQISELKHQPQLNNDVMYYVKAILEENMWEKYKHLFVKKLSTPEYQLIQLFFDNAGMLERVRSEIVDMIMTSWHEKSAASHQIIASILNEKSKLENSATKEQVDAIMRRLEIFKKDFSECDTSFTPNISIASLMISLNNYYPISGTTAYQKLKDISFDK